MKSIFGNVVAVMALLVFPSLCSVARGQGCTWEEGFDLVGLNGVVRTFAVFNDGSGDALYVGGSFTAAGDAPASNIAKWDGANWSALGTGTNGSVNALTVFDDGSGPALYAGGGFSTAGGVSANRIAKWDGANWSALGSGVNNYVYALSAFGDGGAPVLTRAILAITSVLRSSSALVFEDRLANSQPSDAIHVSKE